MSSKNETGISFQNCRQPQPVPDSAYDLSLCFYLHVNALFFQTDLGPETQVAYVDVLEGEKEGFVRFKDADSATRTVGHSWPTYQFTLLTGKIISCMDKVVRLSDKQ